MTEERASDKARLALMTADRARRSAFGYFLRSPFYRWRYSGLPASQLLFVPQDLRTADASFAAELQAGHLGLAGYVAEIGDASPFDVNPPSRAWQDRLHGFAWLRHLRAAREEGGRELARELVLDWIGHNKSSRGVGFEPATTARRIIAWLGNSGLLLEDVDPRTYDTIVRSLELQLQHLAGSWRDAPPGQPRLLSLIALVYAGLCIGGQEQLLALHRAPLASELEGQILPFGGHISRNTGVLVELLMDLLPLAQCFTARQHPQPEALGSAIKRMFPWLRAMRLGDGHLARFNGVGALAPAGLAIVLAYDDTLVPVQPEPRTGYLRLEAGGVVVIADVGSPPPLELSGDAHAGCLSFEMSSGPYPVIVNCGVPGPVDQSRRMQVRSTAAHSTLALDGASSSRLVLNRSLQREQGAPGLSGPDQVHAVMTRRSGGLEIEASHDGYVERFGLLHQRSMRLDVSGTRLDGCDRLAPADAVARIRGDLPYGVHFHLHPGVACRLGEAPATADLELPNGELWRLQMKGQSTLAIEESTYLAELSGPRRSVQVVLRGRCLDTAEVHWRLERISTPASVEPTRAAHGRSQGGSSPPD